jgi:hypothetical protein
MKIASLPTLFVCVFICSLSGVPAHALAARTFVSAAGSDSNNCINVATPCRHLAAAYAATAANGEIYVLDPANYGSLVITGPVSIEGHGWASIAPVANSTAIAINANPGDKINIIGVVLDGTALAQTNGIVFNSGGTLTVRDCVIRNFAAYGIDFKPNSSTLSQLFVSNTLVSDNGQDGIQIIADDFGTTTGVLDHVQLQHNSWSGLNVLSGTQTINITVSDSVIANNGSNGVIASSTSGTPIPVSVMVRSSTIANHPGFGLAAVDVGATIRVTRSTITGNFTAWDNTGGAVLSYGDNNIDGNQNANTEPPNPLTYR